MRVYYFTTQTYGLDNIQKQRLKISDFNNLNDPFELLGIKMSDRSVRHELKSKKSELAKKFGLICFSLDWQNPVQWGHYADSHKGICLGFDVDDSRLIEVKYVKKRLSKDIFSSPEKNIKLLTTKFKHWEYEREYRIIIDLSENVLRDNGLFFEPFSHSLQLREVIIGSKSEITQNYVAEHIKQKNNSINIFNSRAAFRDFRIVHDRSKKSLRA